MFYIFESKKIAMKNIERKTIESKREGIRKEGFGWIELIICILVFSWIHFNDFEFTLGRLTISNNPEKKEASYVSFGYLELEDKIVANFINEYSVLANRHEKQFGIPAELKIASAILESRAGTRDSAAREGVHFLTGTNPSQKSVKKNWQRHSEYIHKGFKKAGLNISDKRDWEKYFEAMYSEGRSGIHSNLIQGIVEMYGLEMKEKYLALN